MKFKCNVAIISFTAVLLLSNSVDFRKDGTQSERNSDSQSSDGGYVNSPEVEPHECEIKNIENRRNRLN